MKDWYVMVSTYNTYGGHRTLSLLSPFFLKDLPDCGPALQELNATFHFASPGPSETLKNRFDRFHAERAKLPKVVFRRARQSASIDFATDFASGDDIRQNYKFQMDWFIRGAHELAANLELLRRRFKKTDHFDLNRFLSHCRRRLQALPSTEADFLKLAEQLELQEKLRRESLSAWDRLGIDFRDFHPGARQILDDPFYWDGTNDFAPNGNDTGADLLHDYRAWLKRHSPDNAPDFLDHTLRAWGLENDEEIRDQATLGLAFADIKLRGLCHPLVRERALATLAKQIQQAQNVSDENLRADWLRSRENLQTKLLQITGE